MPSAQAGAQQPPWLPWMPMLCRLPTIMSVVFCWCSELLMTDATMTLHWEVLPWCWGPEGLGVLQSQSVFYMPAPRQQQL